MSERYGARDSDGERRSTAGWHALAGRLGSDRRRLAVGERDAEDGAGGTRPRQVVELAVGPDLQVHRGPDPAGEGRDHAAHAVVAPDPPAAEICEEVVTHVLGRKLRGGRIVEGAAGDGAARGGG